MKTITDYIGNELGISANLQLQIFKTLPIIILMALFYRFLKKMLYKVVKNSINYYRLKKATGYLLIFISAVLIGRIWFTGVRSLTTFFGLFSAGLAITMKDLIMNVAGWAYIVWKGPFRVGDRIEIKGVSGDVIDIKLFEFALMETQAWVDADQSTGRIVYIPNSVIFKEATFNYSTGIPFIWNEIPIHITHESDWEKAKKILEGIAINHGESISEKAEKSIKEASKKFMLFNARLDPTVYTSINNTNSITLTIRYLCSYRQRRDSAEKIYEEVLRAFASEDTIEFAYPTQRVFDRYHEKKDSLTQETRKEA